MTSDSSRALLSQLTPSPDKVEAYLGDTYVLESVEHLTRLGIDPATFARRHSLLLLKPDAIVARAVAPTLEWLGANGFEVVGAYRVAVDRHLARALWYFAWNIASPERRRLADLLVDISDALVLVVRDTDGALPAPVRLTEAKGATDPRKRRRGELRYLLGRHNYLLNLVHSPDDPADVLRELAIYFDEPTRAGLLTRLGAGVDQAGEVARIAAELYERTPAGSFDRASALARIARDLGAEEPVSDEDCARLLYSAWDAGRDLDPWSVIVLGSYVLPMRSGTRSQTLRPVAANDWLEARP